MLNCLRPVVLLMCAVAFTLPAIADDPATGTVTDTYHYEILYRWGFIRKEAGTAEVIAHVSGDTVRATLAGHSIPWNGRVYTVRDTLDAFYSPAAENILYLNGRYTKPLVGQHPHAYRSILGHGTLDASHQTMEAVTIMGDMLGMYALARIPNPRKMKEGQTVTLAVRTSQSPDDSVAITYDGKTSVTLPSGQLREAWQVTILYSYRGVSSGYPVQCLIDTRTDVPLMFAASLSIGHVEMILME